MERVGWKGGWERTQRSKSASLRGVHKLCTQSGFCPSHGTSDDNTFPGGVRNVCPGLDAVLRCALGQGFWCPSGWRLWFLSGFQCRAAACLWVRSLARGADKLQHGAGSTCVSSRLVGEVPCYRRLPALVGSPWPLGMPNVTGTDACYCFKLLKAYLLRLCLRHAEFLCNIHK